MKKINVNGKLKLNKESISSLTTRDLEIFKGGHSGSTCRNTWDGSPGPSCEGALCTRNFECCNAAPWTNIAL
jgi:natural product precursor